MKESTNPVTSLSEQQRIESELLHAVLGDDTNYPWNPYDPAVVAYFDRLEASVEDDALVANQTAGQWQALAEQAAQLWTEQTPSLTAKLTQRFATRMPAALLTQLVEQAQTASQSGKALLEQLVDCAQVVLAGWETDDLQVMARPLALAMRDGQGEILDITLRSVRTDKWENLTDIEQARLSLVIARYALDEIAQP